MANRPLFIQWNERNDTGIALIDEQHKGIVSIINTFYHLMGLGWGSSMLYSCISDTMKNYSRTHFMTEENFLESMGYKDLEQHKALHGKLSHEIERIEYKAVRVNEPGPLLDFLKKWWLDHINDEDRRYAQFLRANGKIQR